MSYSFPGAAAAGFGAGAGAANAFSANRLNQRLMASNYKPINYAPISFTPAMPQPLGYFAEEPATVWTRNPYTISNLAPFWNRNAPWQWERLGYLVREGDCRRPGAGPPPPPPPCGRGGRGGNEICSCDAQGLCRCRANGQGGVCVANTANNNNNWNNNGGNNNNWGSQNIPQPLEVQMWPRSTQRYRLYGRAVLSQYNQYEYIAIDRDGIEMPVRIPAGYKQLYGGETVKIEGECGLFRVVMPFNNGPRGWPTPLGGCYGAAGTCGGRGWTDDWDF
jgi:hypothetical protein